MSTSAPAPFGVAPSRTPVVFDADTSGLRIGPYERHVDDPAEPTQVYSAYLSLLYAVRGAKPGERLALRAADLEALLLLVGDDPETIEQRLVGLMGCTAEEASLLGGLLLRHRRVTATLGIAAGLALGVGGVTAFDEPTRTSSPAAVVAPAAEGLLPIAGTTTSTPTTAAAPTFVGPPTGVVTVAGPQPIVAEEPEVVAPVEAPDEAVDAAPVAPRPAPVAVPVPVAAAVPAAVPPAETAAAPPAPPVVEPEVSAYELPLYEEPVMDAPPPVEELPDADIGTPAILDLDEPLEEIGGVTDSGELLGGDTGPVTAEPPLDLQAPVEVVTEERSDLPPAEDLLVPAP